MDGAFYEVALCATRRFVPRGASWAALSGPPFVALSVQKAPHREARKAPPRKRHGAQSATEEAPRGTKRHRDATRKRHPLKCHHLIQRHKEPCIHHAAVRLRVTRRAHATQVRWLDSLSPKAVVGFHKTMQLQARRNRGTHWTHECVERNAVTFMWVQMNCRSLYEF